ncbi:MAG: hypothetical protein JO089_04740 [Alphaproteobacteria bacterium]|nr:hypothetical protein [Alphaproteobacteria bacterium]
MPLAALRQRRQEIAAEVRGLTEALRHLDATIRLFEQGKPPKPRQRHISRALFQAMREAGRPMTAAEIAEATGMDVKRVMGTLCYQREETL